MYYSLHFPTQIWVSIYQYIWIHSVISCSLDAADLWVEPGDRFSISDQRTLDNKVFHSEPWLPDVTACHSDGHDPVSSPITKRYYQNLISFSSTLQQASLEAQTVLVCESCAAKVDSCTSVILASTLEFAVAVGWWIWIHQGGTSMCNTIYFSDLRIDSGLVLSLFFFFCNLSLFVRC